MLPRPHTTASSRRWGVRCVVGVIAPFTDVASHPGGNCAVQGTAIKVVGGQCALNSLCVSPEAFQVVVLTGLGTHQVHQHRAIVQEHPAWAGAFDLVGPDTFFFL